MPKFIYEIQPRSKYTTEMFPNWQVQLDKFYVFVLIWKAASRAMKVTKRTKMSDSYFGSITFFIPFKSVVYNFLSFLSSQRRNKKLSQTV